MEPTAGDRYRVEVSAASLLSFFSIGKRRRGERVSIVDLDGRPVWSREVPSKPERDRLVALIHTQVFTAGLQDFEHWLRTEGSQEGAIA